MRMASGTPRRLRLEYKRASRNSRIFRVAAIELRNGLTRQRHQRGAVMLTSECLGLRGFGRVGERITVRPDRTEAGQLLIGWCVGPSSPSPMLSCVNM